MAVTVKSGKHETVPFRVVKDGDRFRGQWVCRVTQPPWNTPVESDTKYFMVCGRWYKSEKSAVDGAKREIAKLVAAHGKPDMKGWPRFPKFSTRRTRNPDHRCAAPGELSSEERGELPAKAFALPKQRKYPLYSLDAKGELVPDPSHASNAKARATQQYNAGKLSKSRRDAIHRKANKVLEHCRRDNPDDFGNDWPELKRAPAAIDGHDTAELGKALEVEAGGLRLQFAKRPHMYWDPRTSTLMWFQGGERSRARNPADVDAKAAKAFEDFMGRDVEREFQHTMPRMPNGVWRKVGRADRFDYWSDKFDEPPPRREYTHGITSAVNLYRGGGPKPPWIWMLRGGKLRITRRGIEG